MRKIQQATTTPISEGYVVKTLVKKKKKSSKLRESCKLFSARTHQNSKSSAQLQQQKFNELFTF
jgi:hypothetical protein